MKAFDLSIPLALAVFIVSPFASAQAQGTPQERSACIGDAFRFCSTDIPNVAKIEAWLRECGIEP